MSTTIGSLFAGIGGLDHGLERAGLGPVLFQVESDPFCREVLARHWPDARRFDDVRTVGAAVLPRVDVLCGGFPCQDLSDIGRGAGLTGARSGLWFEFLRLIGELAPRFVVIENAPGLVRRGLDTVVAGLDALGYGVVGTRLRASDVGAPHRRERLFLVADALRFGREGLEPAGAAPGSAQRGSGDGAGVGAVPVLRDRMDLQSAWRPRERVSVRADRDVDGGPVREDAWEAEPRVGRVVDGSPGRVARLRAIGNAVVPACGEVAGRLVRELADGCAR